MKGLNSWNSFSSFELKNSPSSTFFFFFTFFSNYIEKREYGQQNSYFYLIIVSKTWSEKSNSCYVFKYKQQTEISLTLLLLGRVSSSQRK